MLRQAGKLSKNRKSVKRKSGVRWKSGGGTEAELRVKAAFPIRSLGTRTKKVMMCSSECLCCYLNPSRLLPSLHSGSQVGVLPLSNCWRSQEGRALYSNPATAEAVLRPSPCGAWQAGFRSSCYRRPSSKICPYGNIVLRFGEVLHIVLPCHVELQREVEEE